MNGGADLMITEHVHGANNTHGEIADARVTISTYLTHIGYPRPDLAAPDPQRIEAYRNLVDELGLNGRPMRTSSHYRKNNPKWVGEL